MSHPSPVARITAAGWSLGIALLTVGLLPLRWWRPDCAIRGDGPIPYVTGFPLPFIEKNVALSMTWGYAPGVLVLDVGLLLAVLYPVLVRLAAHLKRPLAPIAAGLGLVVAGLAMAGWSAALLSPMLYPVAAVATYGGQTNPLRFIPAALAEVLGKPACRG